MAFGAEAEDEAQDSWIVKSLSGLRTKLKKQQVFLVLPEHHVIFNRCLVRTLPHQPHNLLFYN